MIMVWTLAHGVTPKHLGFIPSFLDEEDPRSAKEQIDAKYVAGWNKFDGFKFNKETCTLSYPGDPVMYPLAATTLHNELVLFYEHAWVLIWNYQDDTWETARVD